MMSRADQITIVSGLPRSGTSMMMRMLEAGGIAPLVDGQREADEDNPKGYYEFELVKKIKEDTSWLIEAKGRVVKVISQHLMALPPEHTYRIVFMRRAMPEILASQEAMMKRRGTLKRDGVSDEEMGRMLLAHAQDAIGKARALPNAQLLEVSYNEVLTDPSPIIPKIASFLGGGLDEKAMAASVEKSLYRNRKE